MEDYFLAHFEAYQNSSILGTKSIILPIRRVKVSKNGAESLEIEANKFKLPANGSYSVQLSNFKGSTEAMAYLNDVRLPTGYMQLFTTSTLSFEIRCGKQAHGHSKLLFCEIDCNPCIFTLKFS